MLRCCLLCFVWCLFSRSVFSQSSNDFYFKSSSFTYGASVGISHYIGDLNPQFESFQPGISFGAFIKKYYNNYIALRYQVTGTNFGYDDKYASNLVRKNRNLNFKTDLIEFAVQGDFHFFYYSSGTLHKKFTPYLTLGLGIFYFDPYTYYNGEKYYLRKLKTEGIAYSPINIAIPIGFGFKWGLNERTNFGIELVNRITFTDYLDDVSGNYPNELSDNFIANELSNGSLGLNHASLDMRGKQRGQNASVDMYFTFQCNLSFNLFKYYCP